MRNVNVRDYSLQRKMKLLRGTLFSLGTLMVIGTAGAIFSDDKPDTNNVSAVVEEKPIDNQGLVTTTEDISNLGIIIVGNKDDEYFNATDKALDELFISHEVVDKNELDDKILEVKSKYDSATVINIDHNSYKENNLVIMSALRNDEIRNDNSDALALAMKSKIANDPDIRCGANKMVDGIARKVMSDVEEVSGKYNADFVSIYIGTDYTRIEPSELAENITHGLISYNVINEIEPNLNGFISVDSPSLTSVASNYNTSVQQLKDFNNNCTSIQQDQTLYLPISSKVKGILDNESKISCIVIEKDNIQTEQNLVTRTK